MNGNSICPCCGKVLHITKYQEEIWGHVETVEIDAKCKCGYHYNKAYGDETVEYPREGK